MQVDAISRKPRGVDGCGVNEECLWSIFLHLSGARNGYDVDMNPPRRSSPTESPLLFEIDDEPQQETLTAWGGVPLVVQAFRSPGVLASVRQHVQIKQRERGYDEATMVESFVVLNAVGGECLDDFQHFRDDAGLKDERDVGP